MTRTCLGFAGRLMFARGDRAEGGLRIAPWTAADAGHRRLRIGQPAFFLASLSQVSTTVSGFSDTDSMP